jgi:hypothetical protein
VAKIPLLTRQTLFLRALPKRIVAPTAAHQWAAATATTIITTNLDRLEELRQPLTTCRGLPRQAYDQRARVIWETS